MYQIINRVRNLGRDKILILALIMNCDLDETQRLLTLGKRHKLYPKEDRDALIIYTLANRCSLTETNELLSEKDQPILE